MATTDTSTLLDKMLKTEPEFIKVIGKLLFITEVEKLERSG